MTDRVGIIAATQSKYEESKLHLHPTELVWDVVGELLNQTGLTFAEDGTGIDATVTCSSDHWDGKTISDWSITGVVGGHYRDSLKVAEDGAWAVMFAMMEVLSGHHDVVLVAAHAQESVTEGRLIENAGIDHIYHRKLGLDFLSAAAMQARRYMDKYGITPEQCAQVVVKNRHNAGNNPYAQAPMNLHIDDILNSPILASPISKLDTKPVSDGACALIIANEEKAKKYSDRPVWIKGAGNCYDTHYPGDRELADCDALVQAAQRAYRMAGISDPRREIDVAELSDNYSYQELLWTEGLGFCSRGQGGKILDDGLTQMGGEIPVNPSGGLLSGVPVHVAGASRIAEIVMQLQGKAGARQVPDARTGLAQGACGVCGQMQCVFVLEKGA